MAEQPAIDPRYDPAFQRGYDGTVATSTRAEVAARRSAPYVASALQRPIATPHVSEPPAAPRAEAPAEAEAPASAPVIVQTPAPPLGAPWSNPFAIAAAVLGIVVLAAGIWLMQESYRMLGAAQGFESQADYWFVQVSMFGGPITAAVGIGILAGVLFFCASYWARRPRPDEH